MNPKKVIAAGRIDVVVFTMEGREHLFLKTIDDLRRISRKGLAFRTILAVDGNVDMSVLLQANPDLILTCPHRRGYIGSIIDALRLVKTDMFLWIEDDWNMDGINRIDVERLIKGMRLNDRILQVRWSKTATLEVPAKTLFEDIRESDVGFSANPNVCNTQLVRAAFAHL